MTRQTTEREKRINEAQNIAQSRWLLAKSNWLQKKEKFTELAEQEQFTNEELEVIVENIISNNKNYELIFILARTQKALT
ncbi:hypothetical protein AYM02_01695 [Coxiella burnetii]|nr:hypothetical protein AUR58_01990 [Coxiella burnetii]AML54104.1 hypothetical protein AYM38_01670 [Coxiella burnetii]ARI66802.1 hypothetical protein B7L74_10675 [Coxiella burnetii]ARK28233.1 hypothetical protein BMW92_10310 [Coxiella burnetii]ATN68066.1 hypothetical protein AYM00_01720 [Coxiella burnetii]